MKKDLFTLLLIAFIGLFTFSSCSDNDEIISESNTIVDIALGDEQFSTLVAALQKTNLVSVLQGSGPFTVFAPTNTAFSNLLNQLGASSLDDISADALAPILLYHVLGGAVSSSQLATGYVSTVSPGPNNSFVSLYINLDGGVALNGSSNVTAADIVADNGIIHVIDEVLTPPTVVDVAIANGSFSTLVSAVVKAELVEALTSEGPFTVFAPTNDAFSQLLTDLGAGSLDDIPVNTLTDVLLYHVVSGNVRSTDLVAGMVPTLNSQAEIEVDLGSDVTLNSTTKVVAVDVQATNGVVHVIDKVLLP
jgi:transforming growth factor-beta-induced protein